MFKATMDIARERNARESLTRCRSIGNVQPAVGGDGSSQYSEAMEIDEPQGGPPGKCHHDNPLSQDGLHKICH